MREFIVIGAGYGGLAAASLLAKNRKDVLLLESHSKIGGCASFYKRKEFTFDVGATTISGVKKHQPLGKLFNYLELKPELLRIDPGLIVKLEDKQISRNAHRETWIKNAELLFNSENQRKFWNEVFETNDLAWQFISENNTILPRNFNDIFTLTKLSNLKYTKLLPYIFKSVHHFVEKYNLTDTAFHRFLQEQLLITTQNSISDSPFLTAAMGLAYPSDSYYPVGGMYKPAELLFESFKSSGGEIQFKKRVKSIGKVKSGYLISLQNGDQLLAKNVISNIPIWNMVEMTDGKIKKYFEEKSKLFNFSWGAFTVNFGIESKEELDSLYYQIHTNEKIPHSDSNSFFVSFSHIDDRQRAPEGSRSVTISLHTNVKNWMNLSEDEYKIRKEKTTFYIISQFDKHFPQFMDSEKLHLLSGTPKTFQFYTGRSNGFVGGIPHSVSKNLLKMPSNISPFDGLYLVGDTVFPGQGTPAVVLGALNIVNEILN
ncbi:MAG: FAD-dependent oxidoreductase [Melioribacteraceae bacterium]|nr:MAG: FAD-dependent oxidoreductase [Melioribacteraceae bacterium]